jgi:endonuclease/exonuclease/phosphatase family metal-dependent hydrolase
VSANASAALSTHGPATVQFPSVSVVTYNIHTCVGVDRRYDPSRISAVLREIDADIACLQEVDARRWSGRYADQWAYLGVSTGRRVVTGTGGHQPRLRFGNAILTRFPVLSARLIDLTVAGYQPRGAVYADLLIGERVLRVITAHFGLHAAERRQQANQLIAAVGESMPRNQSEARTVLLMGDLNEWRGRHGAISALDRSLGPSAAARTFPSWMPVLALDRIYTDGPAVLRDVDVYRSPLTRLASDHLPLVGRLCWNTRGARNANRFGRGIPHRDREATNWGTSESGAATHRVDG